MGHTFFTGPFSSPYRLPLLFTQIATQKEALHKMFAADLQSVFIKLERIMLTSSMAQQFGGTEGTLSTLANSHNLLLFIQCDPTLVLELGFIHHLLQLHPPAPAVTLLYGSSKLRGGIGREENQES